MARKGLEEGCRSATCHLIEGLALVRDSQLVFINPALCEILGYSAADLVEFKWGQGVETVPEDDRGRIDTTVLNFIVGPVRSDCRESFRLVRPDGTTRQVEAYYSHVLYDGQPALQIAVVDVTDRHETEEALRRLGEQLEKLVEERTRMLEQTVTDLESFNQSVSHDLRAPLRAIRGFSAILLEDYRGSLDERGRDYLQRACKGAEQMENLVEGLLKLSRLTKGELRLEDIDLSAEVTALVIELEMLDHERHVTCRVQRDIRAWADRTLLRDVIWNLLHNAWKFTEPRNRAEIEFGMKVVSGERVYWIADNGVGFEQTQAKQVFAMYRRLSPSDGFEGDGIGLAVVDRIVSRHGGRAWAESEPGRGATIFFTLGTENPGPPVDMNSSATHDADPDNKTIRERISSRLAGTFPRLPIQSSRRRSKT